MADTERTLSPPDDVLVAALRKLRANEPTLGAAKVLERLKVENPSWVLAEKRLKKVMNSAGLGTVRDSAAISAAAGERHGIREEAHALKLQPLQPFMLGRHLGKFDWAKLDGTVGHERDAERMKTGMSDALLHQLDYIKNSDRGYRLYGRGRCD